MLEEAPGNAPVGPAAGGDLGVTAVDPPQRELKQPAPVVGAGERSKLAAQLTFLGGHAHPP
jgi:hypothetical protein